MSRLIFVDTETTGLPKRRSVPVVEAPRNWPDIISIAWSIYEVDNNQAVCLGRKYHVIKPEGWIIHPKAEEIHGISIQEANRIGKPMSDVMSEFQKDATDCTLVAHHIQFDLNVIQNAFYWRMGGQKWEPVNTFCTMESCGIRNNGKPPKLDYLYEKITGEPPMPDAHQAARDVLALEKIYWTYMKIQVIEPEVEPEPEPEPEPDTVKAPKKRTYKKKIPEPITTEDIKIDTTSIEKSIENLTVAINSGTSDDFRRTIERLTAAVDNLSTIIANGMVMKIGPA